MSSASLSSASGLRPMSAFVVIGAVMLSVAGWILYLSAERSAGQPFLLQEDVGLRPSYAIADAKGRTLARFVPRFDLEMSPRAMWQAHTPRKMAAAIAATLGHVYLPEELLERFFPSADGGVIEVAAWDLSPRQANRLADWIDHGVGGEGPPLEGIWIEGRPRSEGDGVDFRLCWRPDVLLSAGVREAHGFRRPRTWTRRLADGIDQALSGSGALLARDPRAREDRRAEVWSALLPRAYCRPLEGLPPDRVLALRELLKEEGVAPLQMQVAISRDRTYPAGEHELYGSWGFVNEHQTEPLPREGLELLCDRLLTEQEGAELENEPAVYRWLADRTVRGERANGYVFYEPASAPPVVETTLDLHLQHFVRSALEELLETHRPAVAMAMAIDLASGEVLAVDSVEAYPIEPFAPIYHVFTPGSSLKVLTMASALEEDVVLPSDRIDVGDGKFRVIYPDGDPSGRVISEAEGAPTGVLTAAECLAHSVNAGLAQIGLRMSDASFRGYLERLGYGEKAGSGLGSERAGHLRELPWKYAWAHASVCFGHEISTTLWQHTEALATVVRGGVHRPLRILRGVEQEDRSWVLQLGEGERVFSPRTSELVRDMMRLGAREGTGDKVRLRFHELVRASLGEDHPVDDYDLGTKTGTAQKVPGELCCHVELSERLRWREAGLPATRERVRGLRSLPPPHARCYTSSVCVFGRKPGDDRELMVFVVADEPRGKLRFGSDVAGPTAAAILAEAMGITRNGESPEHDLLEGFLESELAVRNRDGEPWREAQ